MNLSEINVDPYGRLNRPGPQPENAGITPGYVLQSSMEERLTRLEGMMERIVAVIEAETTAMVENFAAKSVEQQVKELEAENRRLRAELGEMKR